jgi:hypothetical protein
MTEQDTKQNEATLENFLDRADKQFVYKVGLTSLALLTEQLPPEQYQAFLSDCVDNAAELQKHKMLNSKTPKDTAEGVTSRQ